MLRISRSKLLGNPSWQLASLAQDTTVEGTQQRTRALSGVDPHREMTF